MRLAYYAGVSTAAAAACLIKAFHERPNFYSATVYLSQSNACLLIITNLLLLGAFALIYSLQRLLYGRLRPIEVEQLSEKAWYAVLDTLLAMPSFREDVGGWLLTMFVLLLAGKVWGWIGEGRVDILEQQPPSNPRLFHARLATSLITSVAFDIWMTSFCFDAVVADPRPGMMVIFTFEFAILSIFSSFTLLRYTLSVINTVITRKQMVQAIQERENEIRAERAAAAARAEDENSASAEQRTQPIIDNSPIEVDENEIDVPGWEEKRRWLFGLEVFTDFLKLLLYVIFFTVSITFNGLPMHIMRDVYMTAASFSKRVSDYVNYKKATSDMNSRYPDATTEEIRGDACIVCREDMVAWSEGAVAENGGAIQPRPRRDEGQRAKKLPCGHILHLRCLKAWLERQQVCPTCRRPVVSITRAGNTQNNPAGVAAPAAAMAAGGQPAPAAHQNPNANAARAPVQAQNQHHNQGAAQNVPQQPAVNRARFFNLGPLRIGFLNGPAGQMENLVNQLRNGQPIQGQHAPIAQHPGQVANAAPTPSSGTSRVSQEEILSMSRALMQEAWHLNLERAQVETLRAMSQEITRLRLLHGSRDFHSSAAVVGGPVVQTHTDQGLVTQLNSSYSQQMSAGSSQLPPGLVLPDGWTLTPLHRQIQAQAQPMHQTPIANSEPQSAVNVDHGRQHAGQVNVTNSTHSMSSRQEHSARESSEIGPLDDAGSPLFVPSNTTTSDARSNGQIQNERQDTTLALAQGQPESLHDSSTDWNFDATDVLQSSERYDTEQQQASHLRSETSDPPNVDKGKGRAVQIEDDPSAED